jgi:hypothetical protein
MADLRVFDIDPVAFAADPYPTYARLRREAPVALVPQLGAVLLTRRDDIFHWEKEIDVFSSVQPDGLMVRLMGENMMRKDGAAHMSERKVYMTAVNQRAVRDVWSATFARLYDEVLAEVVPRGECDIVADVALPYAGASLVAMTGLDGLSPQTMDAWSQAMIDGIANYGGDAAIEARCKRATAEIDAAIDAAVPARRRRPDASLLSVMLEGGMPLDHIRHNIKLTISGGQNEPRKAIAGAVWALLTHADARAALDSGRVSYAQVLEEYLRWLSPIGMSPRRIARDVDVGGVTLREGQRAFFMFASANRDERHFADADRFDPTRDTTKAIAFGAGPHFCAGAWASRAMIAQVALPSIFKALPGLRLAPDARPKVTGWAFRGLVDLPVVWDVA